MIDIPIHVIDLILIGIVVVSVIFLLDWLLSGKKTIGEYGTYRNIPPAFLFILFFGTATGCAITVAWVIFMHPDLFLSAGSWINSQVRFV